jgi:hypothetical protein
MTGTENETCDLCGLPLGAADFRLMTNGKELKFCCDGCRAIYQMLYGVTAPPVEKKPQSTQDRS